MDCLRLPWPQHVVNAELILNAGPYRIQNACGPAFLRFSLQHPNKHNGTGFHPCHIDGRHAYSSIGLVNRIRIRLIPESCRGSHQVLDLRKVEFSEN